MDLNDDGYHDILSGSYSRMGKSMAGLFQVLWGQDDGTFKPAEALADASGEPLIIPPGEDAAQNGGVSLDTICTRPMAVDWDADGDLDLVVGNFGGTFYLFVGEGRGVFQPVPQRMMTGGQPLSVAGHHSDPFAVDWDGDGDLDLLSGSSEGGVQWAENVASAGQPPELKSFVTLIPSGRAIELGQILTAKDLVGPGSSTRVWVDDVNSDGKLDLLVGDSVSLSSPADGLSEEEYRQRLASWQEQVQAASKKLTTLMAQGQADNGQDKEQDVEADEEPQPSGLGGWLQSLFKPDSETSDLEKAQEEWSAVYQLRSTFMTSESTGFVWLYLQK